MRVHEERLEAWVQARRTAAALTSGMLVGQWLDLSGLGRDHLEDATRCLAHQVATLLVASCRGDCARALHHVHRELGQASDDLVALRTPPPDFPPE